MTQTSELIAQQMAAAADNQQTWGNIIYNVRKYNVTGDGKTDDTAAINSLINNTTSGAIVFPPGTYKLSKQGTRLLTYSNTQRGYGLLLLNKSNISLVFMPGAIISIPIDDVNLFNAIWVEGCDDVQIVNPQFVGTGVTATRLLEEGVGVSITSSTRVTVDGPTSTNMRGCARAYNSSDITIRDGFSSIYANEHASGHFVLYTSQDSVIDHCVSYGSTKDGDIFIYGANSINCTIQNSRAHSYVYGDATKTIYDNTAQGIMIDSGGRDCKIINCYAYGYYYGFDFKNNSEGGVISGCTAERCKVGISTRKGDSQTLSPTNMILIKGNTVIPNGGNGNTSPLAGSLAGPFAIMVIDNFGGANILDNILYNSQDISADKDFIGVFLGISDDVSTYFQGGFLISGNNFAFDNRLGPKYGQNQTQAIMISVPYRIIDVTITGNQFDLPYNGIITNAIECYNVMGLTISNNQFSEYNLTGKPVIKFYGCQRVKVTENTFAYHWGLVEGYSSSAIDISGNVSGESINTVPTASVYLNNCQWVTVGRNTQMPLTPYNRDSFYYQDAAGANWVNMQGNTLHLINKTPTTYYSSVATNSSFANNVVG